MLAENPYSVKQYEINIEKDFQEPRECHFTWNTTEESVTALQLQMFWGNIQGF